MKSISVIENRHSFGGLEPPAGWSAGRQPMAACCGNDALARCASAVPKLVPAFGMWSQAMRRYCGAPGAVELRTGHEDRLCRFPNCVFDIFAAVFPVTQKVTQRTVEGDD